MNDHELDRLVATATHVRDGWVAAFDLRAADDELLEEIMATTDTPVPLGSGPPDGSGPPEAPSPFGREHRPHARRRFTTAVAVGAAAALVIGVVLVRTTGNDGDDERSDVGTSGEEAIRPMIVDPELDGLQAYVVVPRDGSGRPPQTGGSVDTWIYGDVSETGITNDVMIRVEPRPAEGEGMPRGQPVTVRGQEGRLCLAEAGRCTLGDGLTEVSWTEPSGTSISVHSRTFDGAQVLAIAEGLRIDGRDVELGDFPAGGERPPLAAELDRRDSSVYQVNYRVGAGGDLFISTDTENEAERIYDIWFFGPRDDGVQGHPARFEDAGGGTFWVAWSPGPGLVVDILMSGVDEATAREIVESVRPATAAEWADLLDQIAAYHSGYGGSDPERDQDPAPGSPDPTIGLDPLPDNALLRETAGGGRVWGWQASNGDLCYRMVNNGASEVCAAEADVLGVSPSADAIAAVVGFAPEGTASIEGGETTFGEQLEGGRLFVWESADGDVPDTLTFLDDDGDEIATREVTVL